MQIPKPTEDDKDYFRSILPLDPRVEVKPMFGNVAGFVNGNMFVGLFASDVGVKLADADREQLLAEGGGPFGPAERPMGGYVALPASWRDDPARGVSWAERALAHVATLPPKAAKPRKPKG
ncbi:MAG TPA: TfoX/Sxy family protein [Jiangellaceae bacterium]|nr:TfoX/Sxy family protein [Jiangellaceae bacterium]